MALESIIGGVLYGHINIMYFYSILAIAVPLGLIVYWISRNKTVKY